MSNASPQKGRCGSHWPFIQWFVADWLADPKVSLCDPATRGILFDWLCNMHALDRSGVITGSREILARLGRCSAVQVDAALQNLKDTNAADITERNGVVTVINRRMKREFSARKTGSDRVQRHRERDPCNGDVTPHNQSPDSQIPKPEPDLTHPINRTAEVGGRRSEAGVGRQKLAPSPILEMMAVDRVAGEIMANRWNWFYDNCKVKITAFTRGSLMTVLKPFVGRATEETIQKAWLEAVRRAHGAAVDDLVNKTPDGYAIACFRELITKASEKKS